MNAHEDKSCCSWRGWPAAFAAIAACLIFIALISITKKYTQPSLAADEARKAERAKALAEVRAADSDAFHNVGWVDPQRGVVRIPIADAMKMTELQWQNPAQARSNLAARVEKATAKLPEVPSQFE